jgi:hypothetical protein
MAYEPISAAYFINPFHLNAYPFIVFRQWLSENVTTATNTHAKIKELLDASFLMQFESFRMKVGD